MTQRRVDEVTSALRAKGMEQSESHHHMFRKTVDGVTTLVTRVSHSSSTIGDGLAKLMAAQCALQLSEFWRLVDCPLSEVEWDRLVRQRCSGGRNPFLRR